MRWVYAGELGPDGGLDWKMPPGGNIPKSGMVPDIFDTGLYQLIRELARSGQFEGRDPDWDASALKVNGHELRRLLERCYGAENLTKLNSDIQQYVSLSTRLGSECYVALVAVAM